MNFFVRVREGGTSCAMIGIESFVASFVVMSVKAIAGRNADKPLRGYHHNEWLMEMRRDCQLVGLGWGGPKRRLMIASVTLPQKAQWGAY